jgi:transposase InsO family protein
MTGRRRYTGSRTDAEGKRRLLVGWEYVHIAIDDCTRLAYAELLPDERATTATAFLRRALAFYRRSGIQVERVLTDNGSAYRSTVHALACRALGIRHLRTRPRRPQTNGKNLCLSLGLLSGWAARLPAPGGLTQAKGMSSKIFRWVRTGSAELL